MSQTNSRWSFFVDRGGTFTDIIAQSPDGMLHASKLLSDDPARYRDATIHGVRRLMGLGDDEKLPVADIAELRVGTTVATNALLQRRGARCAVLVTRGFGDLLDIGDMSRPDIFNLNIQRPEPLHQRVVEVDERLGADGQVLTPLNESALEAQLRDLKAEGIASVAIAFVHAWRYPEHERRAAHIARRIGFERVSPSHALGGRGFLHRAQSAELDAFLTPILEAYIADLRAAFDRPPADHQLLFMSSAGGLMQRQDFKAGDALLSGPAGGVIGMAEVAKRAGSKACLGLDMGGTSADVALYDGEYERSFSMEINGVKLLQPCLRVHTVAAGGGSVLRCENGRFGVGPDSAGADPGPFCYGRGGPLCLSDANWLLGNMAGERLFNAIGGKAPERAEMERAFDELVADDSIDALQAAAGFVEVAARNIVGAIHRVTVGRGFNPGDYPLCCFGGAGGQLACLIAEALGIDEVLLPPGAGVLSAWGIGMARPLARATLPLERELEAKLIVEQTSVIETARADLIARLGGDSVDCRSEIIARCKHPDAGETLDVVWGDVEAMRESFHKSHERRYGYRDLNRPIIIEALELSLVVVASELEDYPPSFDASAEKSKTRLFIDGRWHDAALLKRADIDHQRPLPGPALILESDSTIVVRPGWTVERARDNSLRMRREKRAVAGALHASGLPQAALLEIFHNRFMNIAEQMGEILRNSAASVNIRDRLDFSCAVFDAEGRLVANAPHIPVHLGSMGEVVKAVIKEHGDALRDGCAFAINDPARGGTHLPDITVVSPVHVEGRALFYVAARGHHADIGGIAPGSMPANSKTLDEEGVVLRGVSMIEDGCFQEEALREILSAGRWPARNATLNISDLKAQLGACRHGSRELQALCRREGAEVVGDYMKRIRQNAAEVMRKSLRRLKGGDFEAAMDNGARLSVKIRIDDDGAILDLRAASAAAGDNYNAPTAVCRAVTLYVFRSLLGVDIPLNDGCLEPLRIMLDEGSMLHPPANAAVAAGNVETSQTLADALLAALGQLAASQGTMNNFCFGDDNYQYYETIGGGAGAGAGFDGAGAVQSHMTNARVTDVEILESNFPVRVRRMALRRGSGGGGRRRGGCGALRHLEFLTPLKVSLLGNRRAHRPFGLAGGGCGAAGVNELRRTDGSRLRLPASISLEVDSGDQLIIATPGGGGWGAMGEAYN